VRRRWLAAVHIMLALVAALLLATTRGAALHAQGQPSGAQPGPAQENRNANLTADDYRNRLTEAIRMLEASPTPQTLQQARQTLADVDTVQLDTGEWILLQPLLDDVRAPDIALSRLKATVAQMDLARTDQLSQREARMAAILARSEFSTGETLLDRLLRWVQRWFAQITPASQQTDATTPWLDDASRTLSDGIQLAAGVALAVALAWWLTRFLRSFVRNREIRTQKMADTLPATAAEARVLASRQAHEGSYRNAVRSLYLSALLELEEARLVPADRTYTNRELLARMQEHLGRPSLRSTLAPVVDTFERIWYGIHEPDKQAFDAYRDTIDHLRADVASQAQSGEEASLQT